MDINIQGKPLKEWVEEQKKKDGDDCTPGYNT